MCNTFEKRGALVEAKRRESLKGSPLQAMMKEGRKEAPLDSITTLEDDHTNAY